MRIIKLKALKDFWKKHPDAEKGLRVWYADIESRNWQQPNDIIHFFKNSDVVGNNRIVFNIELNKYRLIVLFRYKIQLGFVRFIGTHKEYDKIKNIEKVLGMQKLIIEPIVTKKQYEKALETIDALVDCKEGSKEEQYLEAISILVHEYEKKHFPILPLEPIEAIKYKMEQAGLSQQDIAKYFGGKNRASEVLNGKRKLTLKMVKALYNNLQIPAEVLLAN